MRRLDRISRSSIRLSSMSLSVFATSVLASIRAELPDQVGKRPCDCVRFASDKRIQSNSRDGARAVEQARSAHALRSGGTRAAADGSTVDIARAARRASVSL